MNTNKKLQSSGINWGQVTVDALREETKEKTDIKKLTMEQKTSKPNINKLKELDENTYIDATLAGFKRVTEDDFRKGKIDKKEYTDLMKILNR